MTGNGESGFDSGEPGKCLVIGKNGIQISL